MEKLNLVYGYSLKDKSYRSVIPVGKIETDGECQGGYPSGEVLMAIYDEEFDEYALTRTSKFYNPDAIPLFVSGAKSKEQLAGMLRKLADEIERK